MLSDEEIGQLGEWCGSFNNILRKTLMGQEYHIFYTNPEGKMQVLCCPLKEYMLKSLKYLYLKDLSARIKDCPGDFGGYGEAISEDPTEKTYSIHASQNNFELVEDNLDFLIGIMQGGRWLEWDTTGCATLRTEIAVSLNTAAFYLKEGD
jgi:hypothetical protein